MATLARRCSILLFNSEKWVAETDWLLIIDGVQLAPILACRVRLLGGRALIDSQISATTQCGNFSGSVTSVTLVSAQERDIYVAQTAARSNHHSYRRSPLVYQFGKLSGGQRSAAGRCHCGLGRRN